MFLNLKMLLIWGHCMDALLYAFWEVICHYIGLIVLKGITLGRYKSREGSLQAIVGFLFIIFVLIVWSVYN